jgi:hypothetical protein
MSFICFEEYDNKNPEIWKHFLRLAREAKAKGFKRYSSKGIFEIIRWETGVVANSGDGFKINNNYTADYARKAMRMYPIEFSEFFTIRETSMDRVDYEPEFNASNTRSDRQ